MYIHIYSPIAYRHHISLLLYIVLCRSYHIYDDDDELYVIIKGDVMMVKLRYSSALGPFLSTVFFRGLSTFIMNYILYT
jgi:hypothetical protein